jgi:hypothetical protein
MSESMIERVARALAGDAMWEILIEDRSGALDDYRIMARAAIEAMREPTEAMFGNIDTTEEGLALAFWHEMIGQALAEHQVTQPDSTP